MIDTYLPLLGFMVLMVGTPGPANLIVMLGGAQVGIKSCVGFIAGLIFGQMALNIFIGFGFVVILANSPILQQTFKYVSAIYMIWLTIRSWNSKSIRSNSLDNNAHQFKFKLGLIVPLLNPKAWVMGALAWSNFAPQLGSFQVQLFTVVLGFAMCQLFFHSVWCSVGNIIGRTIPNSQTITRAMIILTVLIVIWAVTL
jgi:threonine/homoserine/homoserine lactone efflux protein